MNTLGEKKLAVRQALVSMSAAALEADLIVAAGCDISRTHCYAYPETLLTEAQCDAIDQMVQRRLQNEPLAYIVGCREFWSLVLKVTPATLIPRPETECLIEWVLAHYDQNVSLSVADLGTGSGAIAIALAHERSHWHIDATDMSDAALAVARSNAVTHNLDHIRWHHGDWCDALPRKNYNLIISNPPYIAQDDPCLALLQHEPLSALLAGKTGMDAISVLVTDAWNALAPAGVLLLEHGAEQQSMVIGAMEHAGYATVEGYRDLAGCPRFVVGKKQS